jgi:hypothetical protein
MKPEQITELENLVDLYNKHGEISFGSVGVELFTDLIATAKEAERLKAETDALRNGIDWYHKTLVDTQKLCIDNQATVLHLLEEAIAKVQK